MAVVASTYHVASASDEAADALVEWTGPEGYCQGTALHRAVLENDFAAVKELLSRGASVDNGRFDIKPYEHAPHGAKTPLDLAAWVGNPDVVGALVDYGAKVVLPDEYVRGPLAQAIDGGHVDIAEYLAAHGAAMVTPARNLVPELLADAAARGDFSTVEWLLKNKGAAGLQTERDVDYSPINRALGNGHCAVATLLILSGVDVVPSGTSGNPLVHAVDVGDLSLVRLMISRGASITASADGKTALHAAAEQGHLEIARLLVERGASVAAIDALGRQPLHVCARSYISRLLVENGADVNAPDREGNTPLHEAALLRDPDLVRELVRLGAEVNAANERGETPLHRAYGWAREATARALLEAKADPGVRNRDGASPADLTTNPAMLELLEWR